MSIGISGVHSVHKAFCYDSAGEIMATYYFSEFEWNSYKDNLKEFFDRRYYSKVVIESSDSAFNGKTLTW